jgi:hypothetical protein
VRFRACGLNEVKWYLTLPFVVYLTAPVRLRGLPQGFRRPGSFEDAQKDPQQRQVTYFYIHVSIILGRVRRMLELWTQR